MLSAADLSALLSDHGDIEAELVALQWVPESGVLAREVGDDLRVTVRLIIWERSESGRQVTNIKEQQLVIRARHRDVSVERARAWLVGWSRVLGRAMSTAPEHFEVLMPCDLVFDEVLSLKRPQTAEDFEAALRVKSRLGKLGR